MEPTNDSLSYRGAGVNIDAGAALVDRIKPAVKRTRRPGVLADLGGFAGLFQLPTGRFRQPVLVAATDGVGTKLKLALAADELDTIGIDLVAMCANDVVVTGAEPLLFLDYYASGRLDVNAAARVIEGIARGCESAGCALLGGETAELPGLYHGADFDLAGFCVGIVDRVQTIDGSRVQPGDVVLGLASSGPHSNGYSLIRKIIEHSGQSLSTRIGDQSLATLLLAPTRIYVKPLLRLLTTVDVKAMAHITGGGLTENLPRVLPPGTAAALDRTAWPVPPVFEWLQTHGNVATSEMLRTFNCGIGMAVCVAASDQSRAIAELEAAGETVWPIGRIVAVSGTQHVAFTSA